MIQPIIGRQFPEVVIPLIEGAKNSIKIIVFDWRWYPDDPGSATQLFNQAIVRAVRRGVRVEAITNAADTLGILGNVGVRNKKVSSKNLVHAKMMIFDSKDLVIGSHNFTQYAFTMNYEVSVFIQDYPEIGIFIDFFNSLFLC